MLGGGGNLGLNFTGVRGAQRSTEVRVTWNLGPSIFLVRKKYWRELTSGPPSRTASIVGATDRCECGVVDAEE